MKRIGLLFSLFIFIILLAPPSSPTASADEHRLLGGTPPVTMISEGVTSYDLVPPVIVWNDSYSCNEVPKLVEPPEDYDEPEYIYRMPTYRGYIRGIFEQAHDDPDDCNPYEIRSNVVYDGEDIYWTDDSGLVRLPDTANVGDTPQLISGIAKSYRNDKKVEIADGGDYIYAITYTNPNVSSLWQISKADGSWQLVDSFSGSVNAYDLSFDGDYFYWIFGGFLYKGDPETLAYGFINAGVTGYYAEGFRTSCRTTCTDTHYVFIARGDELIRHNNLDGSTTASIYDSVTADYTIYDLVTGSGFVFLLEYKQEGGLPLTEEHTYHLVRVGRSGGEWGYLYDKVVGAQKTVLNNLHTDDTYVYWEDLHQLLKLPHDAETLPYTNLTISQVEITQGLQTASNNVPLIRGKRTFVRVLVQSDEEPVQGVTAHLQLLDDNGGVEAVFLPLGSTHKTVYPTLSPTVLNTHFLFEIPGYRLDGNSFGYRFLLNPYNEPPELDNQHYDNVAHGSRGLIASPEMYVELYHLLYEVNGMTFNFNEGLHLAKEWIHQAYPLADEGNGYFHLNQHFVFWGEEFGSRVTQTHPDCAAYSEENRNKCASDFAYNTLSWVRYLLGSDHLFYGMIPDGAGFVRGRGGNGVAVGPAGTSSWGWDFDGTYTDWYTAHELAHAIGLKHPVPGSVECDHSADDANYPYADAQIGPGGNQVMGLRRYTSGSDIVYALYPDDQWHDVMSYCGYFWLSDYSFERLRTLLTQSQRQTLQMAPAGQELLGVFGVLYTETETANIQILQQFDSGAAIPPLVPGEYAIRLLDEDGDVLAEYAFTPAEADEGGETLNFGQIVDWVLGTARVQIVSLGSGDVWADTAVTLNPPQVSDVTLVNPPDPVDGTVTLQWVAVDADEDALTFDIFYSVDGGTTLQAVAMEVTGSSVEIDTSTLSGGTGIFRVSANDGVHTQTADSPPYEMADKAPIPTILSPANGATFQWGQTVHLTGDAIDYQDGTVAEDAFRWWVNGELVGTGSTISVDDWLVGQNEIRLVVLNSRQTTASTTIHIMVHDDLALPGPDLAVGPTAVGWHVAAGETAAQTSQLTITNVGGGDLTWSAGGQDDWLTVSADSGEIPDTITLTADPTGLGEGQQKITYLTIYGHDDEGSVVETAVIPITLAAGNTWNVPPVDNALRTYLPLMFN